MGDCFEVKIPDPALEDISNSGDPKRLFDKIEEIEEDPHARGKSLDRELSHLHSARAMGYRIIYEIYEDDGLIMIRGAGPRDTIYERARQWYS
jgi:mRNA-degrading endonuclease RelE of RelBE toxin-antitoxin system